MAEYVHAMQTRVQLLHSLSTAKIDIQRALEEKRASIERLANCYFNRLKWAERLTAEHVRLLGERKRLSVVLRDLLRIMAQIVMNRSIDEDLTGNRQDLITALRQCDDRPSKFDELRYFGPALDYLVDKRLLALRCGRERVTLCFGVVERFSPSDWMKNDG